MSEPITSVKIHSGTAWIGLMLTIMTIQSCEIERSISRLVDHIVKEVDVTKTPKDPASL